MKEIGVGRLIIIYRIYLIKFNYKNTKEKYINIYSVCMCECE